MIRAVVLDVGETLVDESRQYGEWADWLGVPRHAFFAVLGAVIARGADHRQVFQHFRPGFDLGAERRRRADAGRPDAFTEADLYPDALPCLQELRRMGVWVGIAGNQPSQAGQVLRSAGLPADMIGTSADWGAAKPDPAFFREVAAAAPCPPGEICHVGDRPDNDIKPAKAAGMRTAFIRRGPWAYVMDAHPGLAQADWRIDTLAELPALVAGTASAEAGDRIGLGRGHDRR